MSLLGNLKEQDDEGVGTEIDSVGAATGPVDSALYESKVNMAYLGKSSGGALSLTIWLETAGREVRNTIYVTSGDAKGNSKTYKDKQTGEKKFLPGYNMANSLCLLTVGKKIDDMPTEKKIVGIYNFQERKDVNTEVEVLVDLLGQEVIAGIINQLVDKNVKNDAGVYVPSGETRNENEIDKFFRAKDKMTTAEIRGGAEEPAFYNTWDAKFTGTVKDRSTKGVTPVAGTSAAFAGGAAPANATAAPTKSLFAA
jgi:hypothetical protein